MDMNKLIEAENWDGSTIQVKLKDSTKWADWDKHNEKNQIHPTQKVFAEAEYLQKEKPRTD